MIPPFVDSQWLAEHPAAVTVDARWSVSGGVDRDGYLAGHLPGAILVDLDHDLAAHDVADGGRHPLPTPEAFAAALGRLGIGDDDVVVAYDAEGGAFAARLVWMLRVTGRSAAVLTGGLAGWSGPLQPGAVERAPTQPSVVAWPGDRLASIDDAAAPGDAIVIDARPAARYAGAPDELDPRAGHIPGARSLPCRGHLAPEGGLLSADELRDRYAAVGITEGQPFISSCGSGVTACLNLLVAERLGLGAGRLYPGSWSQYSRLTERPIETGADPAGLS